MELLINVVNTIRHFMYRRPTLCTLHIAGGVPLGYSAYMIYYIHVDDGRDQVLGRATGI